MNIKKAIIISVITASIVGLTTLAFKSKEIKENKETKEALLTYKYENANTSSTSTQDSITPNSYGWLINEKPTIPTETLTGSFNTYSTMEIMQYYDNGGTSGYQNRSQTYSSNNTYSQIKSFAYSNMYEMLVYDIAGNYQQRIYNQATEEWAYLLPEQRYYTQRLINYTNYPNGNTLAWLLDNATPIYNNNVIIHDNYMVKQIRKANVIISNGSIINTQGTIQLILDMGITKLTINGTNYTNALDTPINITNENIVINTSGTITGQTGAVFTIYYDNNLPVIEPTPIPDASTNTYYDVIDLKPLLIDILTLPFTFLTQAFDVTLWPNTPYEFNIGNFIMAIIAISAVLFVIKLFTSGFAVIGNYTNKSSQTKLNNAKTKQIKQQTKQAKSESKNKE